MNVDSPYCSMTSVKCLGVMRAVSLYGSHSSPGIVGGGIGLLSAFMCGMLGICAALVRYARHCGYS